MMRDLGMYRNMPVESSITSVPFFFFLQPVIFLCISFCFFFELIGITATSRSRRSAWTAFKFALIMGWFTSSSTQEEPSLPDRAKRRKCWETRDAYFTCLDRAGVVKPGEEKNACSEDKKRYETNCAKSWVCILLLIALHLLVDNYIVLLSD